MDLYRGINKFKRGYQPRSYLVMDENGDLIADSHNILNTWQNDFSQLLNVHDIRTPPYATNVNACFIVHSLHYMFRP
jgi:hypothetical protein